MHSEILTKIESFKRTLSLFPEVRYVGDPVLHKPTEEVSMEEGIEIGKTLGQVLMRYREAVGYGRGFAAPQIGLSKSVFVTFVDNQLETFINPKIINRSRKTNFYRELCLSSGVMAADVKRPVSITLQSTSIHGVRSEKTVDGFLSRLYQHEEAHLRGVVNLDEAEPGGIIFATFDPLKEQLRSTR